MVRKSITVVVTVALFKLYSYDTQHFNIQFVFGSCYVIIILFSDVTLKLNARKAKMVDICHQNYAAC